MSAAAIVGSLVPMRIWTVILLIVAGCSNQVELVADRGHVSAAALPAACVPPQFAAGECRADVVNDGTGPDDHRTLCDVNGEHWALYPSGETWHWLEPDGKRDPVLCHLSASGAVLWSQ